MIDQEAFEAWFRGEQGKPCDGTWSFSQAAWHAALAWLRSQGEPVAWVRFCSDGCYEGPIMNCSMEEIRKTSGAWTPLLLAPQPAIPDGWKLVPVEPTPEMLESAASYGGRGGYSAVRRDDASAIWRDMLATAPQPAISDGWIAVKDRLPDTSDTVLVCAGGLVVIGVYEANFGWWFMGADFGDNDHATHWTPLPSAPEPRK